MKRLLRGNHSKAVNVAEVWASAGRVRDLIARKLAPRLSHPIADLRGRQWTTLLRHPLRPTKRPTADTQRSAQVVLQVLR